MSDVTEYDTVRVEFDDGITTITLNRPEKKNAMNPALHVDMYEALHHVKRDALDPDGGSNVVVLTGAGDSFCAGQDLEEFFLEGGVHEVSEASQGWARDWHRFPRATIAAVNGYCFGGGFRLLCSADLAIASEQATFGLSEVNFGNYPAGGSTYVPAQVMGKRDFLYASLTGEPFGAEEADKWRLVNRAVPHDELDDAVRDLAETINDLNPISVQFAKEVYQREMESTMSFEVARDYELAKKSQMNDMTGDEETKAIKAFADRKFRPGVETYSDEDIADY